MEFTPKVRLVEYFDGVDDDDGSLVRNKSNFVPPQGREELLDCFVHNTVNITLIPNEKSNIRRNITLSEQKAISKLANDESIIIKQADKGGAKVIMNRPFYQKQIEKILYNDDYYKQLDQSKKISNDQELIQSDPTSHIKNPQNPHKEIMKKYRSFLKHHEK